MQQNTKRKVFISHSRKDKDYGEALVGLLRGIGLKKDQIVFTSNVDYGIPVNQDIYQYLKEQIENNAHMLYLLSDNYYGSIACMNEMGAAWMMQNKNTLIMLPGFAHTDARFQSSVFNKNQITVGLNDRKTIEQLMKILVEEFSLCPDADKLEDAYDIYFDKIDRLMKVRVDPNEDMVQCNQMIEKNPHNYKMYVKRADLLLKQDKENYRPAIRDYLYAIFLNPEDLDAYYKLLQVAAKHNEYMYVKAYADKLCIEFPEDANMYGCRAYIECEKKHYKQSIKDCDHAISLGGQAPNRWFYNTRGRCYLAQGNLSDALENFWMSHERDASYQPAIDNIKFAARQIGAEKLHEEAIKCKEEAKTNKLKYKKSKMYFETMLMMDADNEEAALEYGGLNYEAGKYKEAFSLWEKLLKKQKNCRNLYLCSLALLCLGRSTEARDYMRLALNYPGDEYFDLAVDQWKEHFGNFNQGNQRNNIDHGNVDGN